MDLFTRYVPIMETDTTEVSAEVRIKTKLNLKN